MKKLTIILGGSVSYYENHMDLFKIVGTKVGWKFKKIKKDQLSSKINGVDIDIRFCWNPQRDKLYEDFKKFNRKKIKMLLCTPSKDLAERIKKTDAVLFVGHCGAFRGKKEEIYIPEEFSLLLLNKSYIRKKDIKNIKPKKKIKIENILKNNKAKNCRVITSNLTLCPDNMEDRDEDLLIKLGKNLQKYGDVVEKESYFIAKKFKEKIPLGMLMISSDILTIKKHMMRTEAFKPDKKNLAKNFIKAVKIMTKEIR